MRSKYYRKKFIYFLELLGDSFPLLRLFSRTEQDAEWHGEVFLDIHIDMVLEEIYVLIDKNNFTLDEQEILIFSALFHDYAKPITTKKILINNEERLGSPRHEEIGASLLFFMDPPAGISSKSWLSIIEIIAFHQLPKLLVVKNKEKKDYFSLYRSVSRIDLLYFLEVADMKGRICKDKSDQLDYLELFKMYCIDYGMWNENPYSLNDQIILNRMHDIDKNKIFFLSEQMCSRFEDGQIWSPQSEVERAFNYINNQNHLVIMVGLPGSGKTTYIAKNYPSYDVVSLDDIRSEVFGSTDNQESPDLIARLAYSRLRSFLRDRKNIVWDATNMRKDFREKISQLGFDYKAFVQIVVLQVPISISNRRNEKRNRVVPKDAVSNLVLQYQYPTLSECHSLKIVT